MLLRLGSPEREPDTEMEGDLDTETEGVSEFVEDTDLVKGEVREMVTVTVSVGEGFTEEEREAVVEGQRVVEPEKEGEREGRREGVGSTVREGDWEAV